MTLLESPSHDPQTFLFSEGTEFPQVLALPERRQVPEGDLYTFCFANGYGALVMRLGGQPLDRAFEFCVLDCTLPVPQPTFGTPLGDRVQTGLSCGATAQLLTQAERLPRHPALLRADEALENEEF